MRAADIPARGGIREEDGRRDNGTEFLRVCVIFA